MAPKTLQQPWRQDFESTISGDFEIRLKDGPKGPKPVSELLKGWDSSPGLLLSTVNVTVKSVSKKGLCLPGSMANFEARRSCHTDSHQICQEPRTPYE